MKNFFSVSIDFISPVLAYHVFRERCDFLFFSGTTRGRYSFLPLDSFDKIEIFSDNKNSFEYIQQKYKKLRKNYDINSIKNWDIPFSGGMNAVFSYDYTQEFEKNLWGNKKERTDEKEKNATADEKKH